MASSMPQTPTPTEILDLEDLGYLGSGSNATVRKAKYRNQVVAVKIFDKNYDKKMESEYIREAMELKRIDHTNVVKLLAWGQWRDKNDIFNCMVIEFADLGTLHHVLYERTDLNYTFGHGISWLKQCADAINYLHTRQPKPTIHRDLKPLNILIMNGGVLLKICDFGTACNLKTIMTVNRGSPCWIAPETLIDENYNEKCDIYSYSIITWEILVRLRPYFNLPNATSVQIMYGVSKGTLRPKNISNCPKLFQLFFKCGWSSKPQERPSMDFIYNMMKILDLIINKNVPLEPLVKQTIIKSQESIESITNQQVNDTLRRQSISSHDALSSGIGTIETDIVSNFVRQNTKRSSGNSFDTTHFINEDEAFDVRSKNETLRPTPNRTPAQHRRSRSFGNEFLLNPKQDQQSFEFLEIDQRIKIFPNCVIRPIVSDEHSRELYDQHMRLVEEDKTLDTTINILTQKLNALKEKQKMSLEYNELIDRKNKLIRDNNSLQKTMNAQTS